MLEQLEPVNKNISVLCDTRIADLKSRIAQPSRSQSRSTSFLTIQSTFPTSNVTIRPLIPSPLKHRSRLPYSLPSLPRHLSKCPPAHRPHPLNLPLQNRSGRRSRMHPSRK